VSEPDLDAQFAGSPRVQGPALLDEFMSVDRDARTLVGEMIRSGFSMDMSVRVAATVCPSQKDLLRRAYIAMSELGDIVDTQHDNPA